MKHLLAIVCFLLAFAFYALAMWPAASSLAVLGGLFELAAYIAWYRGNRAELRSRSNNG